MLACVSKGRLICRGRVQILVSAQVNVLVFSDVAVGRAVPESAASGTDTLPYLSVFGFPSFFLLHGMLPEHALLDLRMMFQDLWCFI